MLDKIIYQWAKQFCSNLPAAAPWAGEGGGSSLGDPRADVRPHQLLDGGLREP